MMKQATTSSLLKVYTHKKLGHNSKCYNCSQFVEESDCYDINVVNVRTYVELMGERFITFAAVFLFFIYSSV